ncbi:S8 family serine peptidase [Nonomuraea candida]|uniref:S8 family serine peptidase n=1 Tax=Nonomuraea candida TaxID=359159 RepID=UPI0012FB8773|nr:S8 family serine peptidase [Nonomuraea candida]
MPRRLGLPSVYLAAAVATAATTAVPLAMTPASGLALHPVRPEPARPYIVTARNRVAARDLVGEVRWRVRRYYTSALPGFATFLTADELAELRADPRVRTIEPDRVIHPVAVRRPARPPVAPAGGAGATVYVLDSGVDTGRSEFGDRAWRAFDATGGTGRDCGGHGTQVAARAHDLAPKAGIASVRVLGCDGAGTLSDVLAGLDWISRHAHGPSVASLAFDGSGSPALTDASLSLARSGVLVVGASGGGTACHVTPDGRVFTPHVPYLAGAAAGHLELHPNAGPAALATMIDCGTSRKAIRQNPSRPSNLQIRNGGL